MAFISQTCGVHTCTCRCGATGRGQLPPPPPLKKKNTCMGLNVLCNFFLQDPKLLVVVMSTTFSVCVCVRAHVCVCSCSYRQIYLWGSENNQHNRWPLFQQTCAVHTFNFFFFDHTGSIFKICIEYIKHVQNVIRS